MAVIQENFVFPLICGCRRAPPHSSCLGCRMLRWTCLEMFLALGPCFLGLVTPFLPWFPAVACSLNGPRSEKGSQSPWPLDTEPLFWAIINGPTGTRVVTLSPEPVLTSRSLHSAQNLPLTFPWLSHPSYPDSRSPSWKAFPDLPRLGWTFLLCASTAPIPPALLSGACHITLQVSTLPPHEALAPPQWQVLGLSPVLLASGGAADIGSAGWVTVRQARVGFSASSVRAWSADGSSNVAASIPVAVPLGILSSQLLTSHPPPSLFIFSPLALRLVRPSRIIKTKKFYAVYGTSIKDFN